MKMRQSFVGVKTTVAFWPFICCATADQQIDFILGGPGGDASKEARLIQALFSQLDRRIPGDISVRVFEFDGEVAFATIFTTDAVEPSSKRTGLKLAIGFVVSDFLYLSDAKIPICVNEILFELLNKSFDLNLPQSGSGTLVDYAMGGEISDQLWNVENALIQSARVVASLKPPRLGAIGRNVRRFFWSMQSRAAVPPRAILVLDDDPGNAIGVAIDALVYEIVVRTRRIDLRASASGSVVAGEIVVRFLNLGLKSKDVVGSVLVRGDGLTYVAIS